MSTQYEAIDSYIEAHKEEMNQVLVNLVNLEGRYDEKEHVEKAMEYFCGLLQDEGFELKKFDVAPDRAGIVSAVLGKDRPGEPILLSGHFDTVYRTGSFGTPACRIEDGKIYGPGVIDMKGGDVMALYIAKALNAIGYDKRPVKMILVGDEEADHVGNLADQTIIEESKGCFCGFNMEPGDMQNRLVVSRKTQHTFFVSVEGVGGHAGNDVLTGKNALLEAVLKIADMAKLQNLDKGSSVTPSIMHCGTQSSAIPDHCEFAVDIRFKTLEEGERLHKGIIQAIEHSYIPGTAASYRLDVARFVPYDETEEISKLCDFMNELASELHMPEFGKIQRGGVSDSGNIVAAGVPTLDGLGIVGEFAHNRKEYGILQTMYDRTKLLAYAVTRIDEAGISG
ncbi:M20/M25/M40 family metallo-hydrolase [Clostridium sp. MCC353]|uniref:M20/M25/M40 family metallo-hydrolase n=1 Tax=Clostridium sp. MCC353 TaxID=2592646 RepID=UPI001C019FCF|nr:M20/M25/M40 family metallo-hydrolase [Clostridium sp. MCC353]MBT9775681.1 M20/M25/M40 family metallo-hydrolase [Clostridium sp. MCC353]